jgi:hypothetical protein
MEWKRVCKEFRIIVLTKITICMAFFFLGCGGQSRRPLPAAEGKIVSFCIGGGGMTRDSFYHYHLREKEGNVWFDASCFVMEEDGLRQIEWKEKRVPKEEMEALRTLCVACNFTQKQNRPHKPTRAERKRALQIMDGSSVRCTVVWENGAEYQESGQTIGCESVMKQFFEVLVAQIDKEENND